MTCQDFPTLYSSLIDGCANEHEQQVLQMHMRECAHCRRRATEMRCLRSELRALGSPRPEPEMSMQIRAALQREARLQASYARERADWMDLWRTRLYSQGIGAVVSVALILVVGTVVLRSALRAFSLLHTTTAVIWEDPVSEEIRYQSLLKARLLQPPLPPAFSPSGELLNVGASLPEDYIIQLTVKVHKDGRASINQIDIPAQDPSVMTRFSNVITERASFEPRRNRNTSNEAVVIFGKMNISG
jgi:anti-sigma factor RsiW